MSAQNNSNQTRIIFPKSLFWLSIHQGAFNSAVFVNGAPVYNSFTTKKEVADQIPITDSLRPGKNTIQIDLEPLNFANETYTPNKNSFVKIALSPMNRDKYPEDVDLFWGHYDMEKDELVPMLVDDLGTKPQLKSGDLEADWTYSLSPSSMQFVNDEGVKPRDEPFVRRLTFYFNMPTSEAFNPLPWENAPVLKDNASLRQELVNAYESFWRPSINKDLNAKKQVAFYIYNTLASATFSHSIDELMANEEVYNAQFPPDETAQPIKWPNNLSDLSLVFNDFNNMVTVYPNPLSYKFDRNGEVDPGPIIYFFRDKQGVLMAGFQKHY